MKFNLFAAAALFLASVSSFASGKKICDLWLER